MSNSEGYVWRMLLFILAVTLPVAIVAFWLLKQGELSEGKAVLLIVAAVVPAFLLYSKLVRDMQAIAARMEQAAVMSNLLEGGDGVAGFRSSLLPTDNLFLALQHYRRVLQHMLKLSQAHQDEAALLFDMLPDPVLVLGSKRRIHRANTAAKRFFNVEDMSGDLTPYLRNPSLLKAVDAAYKGQAPEGPIEFTLSDVVPRYVAAYLVNLEDEGSKELRLILTLHDLTESRRMQQMRVDFVANASHELRTPLAILIGALETLIGPARDDLAAHQRFFTMMQAQSLRMSQLIDDLLSLSQIEVNEYSRPSDKINLCAVLNGVRSLIRAKAADMQKDVIIEGAEEPVFVIGDFEQLTQVFTNLIDNALKYSREETDIRVRVKINAREAAVSVIDEGEGIAEEHLARLTERFYRVDSDRSRKLGGTGLGLAIVKHIVSRHRGNLDIKSTVGKGSSFTVRLPLAQS